MEGEGGRVSYGREGRAQMVRKGGRGGSDGGGEGGKG